MDLSSLTAKSLALLVNMKQDENMIFQEVFVIMRQTLVLHSNPEETRLL